MTAYSPVLKMTAAENNNGCQILVNTISPLNLQPEVKVCSLPFISKATKFDLEFSGFDYFEVSSNGEKYLGGNIYIKEIVNESPILTLLSSPKYLSLDFHSDKSEQVLTRITKDHIKREWSECFSELLNSTFKPRENNTQNHASKVQLLKTPLTWFSSIIKKDSINKKKVTYILIGITAVSLNVAMWSLGGSNEQMKNSNQLNIKSAEQMAVEQDAILNNAFKEIGIDREKLASDMSCFTE